MTASLQTSHNAGSRHSPALRIDTPHTFQNFKFSYCLKSNKSDSSIYCILSYSCIGMSFSFINLPLSSLHRHVFEWKQRERVFDENSNETIRIEYEFVAWSVSVSQYRVHESNLLGLFELMQRARQWLARFMVRLRCKI